MRYDKNKWKINNEAKKNWCPGKSVFRLLISSAVFLSKPIRALFPKSKPKVKRFL